MVILQTNRAFYVLCFFQVGKNTAMMREGLAHTEAIEESV